MTSILEDAQELIHGQRNKDYGHPRENFQHSADLISAYLGVDIDSMDVANIMILMKLSRVHGTGYHRDSYTDIAGYAGCVERIEEEPVEAPLADWERELLAAAKEPRVWYDIRDIPGGTTVIDNEDDTWDVGDDGWQSRSDHVWANGFAPFTEVLKP